MPLRYYQDDAKQATFKALTEFSSALINLPTGAGKTVLAAHLIGAWLPGRCIFLADQDELCQQPLEVINREINVIAALEKASYHADLRARVVVASSQTLARRSRLEAFPPGHFEYAIVDEAHRGADRDREILDYLGCKRVGITATPFKAGLRDLSDYYETVAYSLPMLNLIKEGFAPSIRVMSIPIEIDLGEVRTKQGFEGRDYNQDDVAATIEPYYHSILNELQSALIGRKTLVRLPLVASSKAFAALAREYGFNALHIDGASPDRADILRTFKESDHIDMLCNSQLLTTGADIPSVSAVVNLAPTSSMVAYQQFVGRGMRVLPGVIDHIPGRDQAEERRAAIAQSQKPDTLIVDFLWQHDRLTAINAASLVTTSPQDAGALYEKLRQSMTEEDLLEAQRRVQEEREAELAKKLEEAAARAGNVMPADAWAHEVGLETLAHYESVARWELKPASEKQLSYLTKWGVDPDTVRDRGHASKLMDAMIHRFKYKLASAKQIVALKKKGVTDFNPSQLTFHEAIRLLREKTLIHERPSEPPVV